MHKASKYRECIKKYNSAMAFASVCVEIKSPAGNGPYGFQIDSQMSKYNRVWLYIFNSAEAATKQLGNQSNQGCMAEIIQ
jgi:hypothetical protein